MCWDNSTVWKLGMLSQLTCSHNRGNYSEQGSSCIWLKPHTAADLIMITTVSLVMMIIRTIAAMMRVLFPGAKLTFVWLTAILHVCACVREWKWANVVNRTCLTLRKSHHLSCLAGKAALYLKRRKKRFISSKKLKRRCSLPLSRRLYKALLLWWHTCVCGSQN